MATILISFAGAIIASLLTIFLTPRVHHAFWARERITELRLATYDKVNGITAAIYMYEPAQYVLASATLLTAEVKLSPLQELLASLMAAHDEVKNRFSDAALQAYEKLERLVEASGLPTVRREDYSEARDAILRQLHTESLGGRGSI